MSTYSEKVKEKQDKMQHLLDTKSNLIAEKLLAEKHTQLSYLSEIERDMFINITKEILLDKIIAYLTQLN